MNTSFMINNHEWTIEERPEKELLEEYKERNPNAYACYGLTFYKTHKIWIAEELCDDEKQETLIHELTHCFIWEMGFYRATFDNEEMVCDFVSSFVCFAQKAFDEMNKK